MKRERKHHFLFFKMYHLWIIFFCFFIVQCSTCTKLFEKSIPSRLETGGDAFFTAIKQRETHGSESYLMPHHLYYLTPREVKQNLDIRQGYIAVGSLKNNEKDRDHHIKYVQQFEPSLLKSSNLSTSKIQVAEFKPNSKPNDTGILNYQQNFTSSVKTPTFLGNQEKFLQYKEILQPSSFHILTAPQQNKYVSNLINVNQNNDLQASNLYFHNSPTKKKEPNQHEGQTAVYHGKHNLEDLTINKINEFTVENSKESQTNKQKRLPRLKVPQENEIRFMVNVPPLPIKNNWRNLLSDVENNNERNRSSSQNKNPQFDVFLSILQEMKNLPKNFTSDNLSSGIKTLSLILQRLQEEKKTGDSRSQQTSFAKNTPKLTPDKMKSDTENHRKIENFPQLSETSTPGKPGTDYPIYASIPNTKFDCSSQRYKGFFADPDTNCQVWHYCDLNGGQASFLCPNGTIFSQAALTCDWWFNVKCSSTSQLYVLNERLYKYILPFSPSFPEDYSGPIVDKYLMAKFKEKQTN